MGSPGLAGTEKGGMAAPSATGREQRVIAWQTVAASSAALALGPSVILYMCFGSFAPALHAQFGWDMAAISFGATIIAAVLMCVSPIQGALVDRVGGRTVILCSVPLFALGLGSMASMNGEIWRFYLVCALLPMLALGLWPLSFMRVVSGWFDNQLGLALGLTNAGIGLGAALVPLLIAAILMSAGWRAAYIVLALLEIGLVWPLAAAFLRENTDPARLATTGASAPATTGMTASAAVQTRAFLLLSAAFFFLGIISSGILIHQVNILIEHGLSLRRAVYLQSTLGVALIIGRVVAGWVLDRVHVARVMPTLLLLATWASLTYSSAARGWMLIACAASFGLLFGAEFDVLGYAIRRYFGLRSFGKLLGLTFSVFQFGSALGAAGVGLSHRVEGSYRDGLIGLAIASAMAALLLGMLGAYRYGGDASALEAM